MPCLNKQNFKAKLRTARFALSDDDYVNLRELPAPDLFMLQEQHRKQSLPDLEFAYKLLALAVTDDEGKPLFDSVEELKRCPIGVSTILAMGEEALKLSTPPEKN